MGFNNLISLGLDSTKVLGSTYKKIEGKIKLWVLGKKKQGIWSLENLSVINLSSILVMCKSAHFVVSN